MDDPAIAHFDAMARVLRDLAGERIELFEHRYHPQSFGSFELVLGKGHGQVKFVWDGRESVLSVSLVKIQNKNAVPSWTHDADFSLPGGVGLYEEIASQSVDMLAI